MVIQTKINGKIMGSFSLKSTATEMSVDGGYSISDYYLKDPQDFNVSTDKYILKTDTTLHERELVLSGVAKDIVIGGGGMISITPSNVEKYDVVGTSPEYHYTPGTTPSPSGKPSGFLYNHAGFYHIPTRYSRTEINTLGGVPVGKRRIMITDSPTTLNFLSPAKISDGLLFIVWIDNSYPAYDIILGNTIVNNVNIGSQTENIVRGTTAFTFITKGDKFVIVDILRAAI